jgi:Transglycosylase SLT domain
MKKSHLTILVSLLTVIPAFSQDRPRYFDNFDTVRGVNVVKPPYVPVVSKTTVATPTGNTKLVNGKRYLMPTGSAAPTNASPASKSTARNPRMNVSDGLAERENASSPVNKPSVNMMGTVGGMKGFTTGNTLFDSYIVDSSRKYGIDPLLIYSQMHQESSFKLKALSNKGASGLMQLMPATARRLGVTDIYDPKQNIDGGIKYMRMLLDMFNGDVNLALAGYNAGEGAVMKYGYQIPPYNETREYVRRISARYASISDGTFAQTSRRVTNAQAAKLEKKEVRPLSLYEPNALAIRTPDGRMRLVSQ